MTTKNLKNYYPTYYCGCNPIHPVRSWTKVRKLIRAVRRGDVIKPIVIDGQLGNGSLLNGTHRAAANDLIQMLADRNGTDAQYIDVVNYKDLDLSDDVLAAIDQNDYATINDLLDT